MYIIDTNVISELRKSTRAEPAVVRWSQSVPNSQQYLSAMAIFEIELGILKAGRTSELQANVFRTWLESNVLPAFSGRILAMDERVAVLFAHMMADRTRPYRDTIIAATAQRHGFAVVTRNVRGFVELPVQIINPWDFK